MLGMDRAVAVEDIGLHDGRTGMRSVCPGKECLVALCIGDLVPGNPAAGVLGIVPLGKMAVAGLFQGFVNSNPDRL